MSNYWYAPLFLNTVYAIGGVTIGILAAELVYRLINHITHFELEKRNLAVGVVVCGIFIMMG